ncbi:MAG: hypothetical protein Q4P13_00370 [Psychrobacter sp.]|nr:hypothetical protein [Psychrobacter sp.]
MKKSYLLAIASISMMTLMGCATTSEPSATTKTTNDECGPGNPIYEQQYKELYNNGRSEKGAREMAKYACMAYKVGRWANN